jgi:hypothetical protein
MTSQRTIAPTEDPVCGMRVDVDDARNQGPQEGDGTVGRRADYLRLERVRRPMP